MARAVRWGLLPPPSHLAFFRRRQAKRLAGPVKPWSRSASILPCSSQPQRARNVPFLILSLQSRLSCCCCCSSGRLVSLRSIHSHTHSQFGRLGAVRARSDPCVRLVRLQGVRHHLQQCVFLSLFVSLPHLHPSSVVDPPPPFLPSAVVLGDTRTARSMKDPCGGASSPRL